MDAMGIVGQVGQDTTDMISHNFKDVVSHIILQNLTRVFHIRPVVPGCAVAEVSEKTIATRNHWPIGLSVSMQKQ